MMAKELQAACLELQPEDMTVEQVTEMLEKNDKDITKNTVTNAVTILSCDPVLRDGLKFNELTQKVAVVKEFDWNHGSCGQALTDNDLYNIHLYCEGT